MDPVDIEAMWTKDDVLTLIKNMKATLPNVDERHFPRTTRRLKWDKVKFGNWSSEECQSKWKDILRNLRKTRSLTELVVDAKKWVKYPWCTFRGAHDKVKHPDMPKKPPTSFVHYVKENSKEFKAKNPNIVGTQIYRALSVLYKEMSASEKAKHQGQLQELNARYKEDMKAFRLKYPEYEFMVRERRERGILKPQTPFQLYRAHLLKTSDEIHSKPTCDTLKKYKVCWKNLSDKKKFMWIQKAVLDITRYTTDLEQYRGLHPDYKPQLPRKCSITIAERLIKEKCDGKPIKPPRCGYSLFYSLTMKEIKHIPILKKMRIICTRWKNLTDSRRDDYRHQASELMKKYSTEYQEYLDKLTQVERDLIVLDKSDRKKKNVFENINVTDEAKDIIDFMEGKPTEPDSAIYHFQVEKYPEYEKKYPGISKTERIKIIARNFNLLSKEEKKKYEKMTKQWYAKKEVPAKIEADPDREEAMRNLLKREPKRPPPLPINLFWPKTNKKLVHIKNQREKLMELSRLWKQLDPKERDEYKEKLSKMNNMYQVNYMQFLRSLSPAEYIEYEEYKMKKKGKKVKKNGKKVKGRKVVKNKKYPIDLSEDEEDSSEISEDSASSDDDIMDENSSSGEDSSTESDSDNDDFIRQEDCDYSSEDNAVLS